MTSTLAGLGLLSMAATFAVIGGAFFGLSEHTVPAMIVSSVVLLACIAVGAVLVFAATVFLVA